VTRVGVVLQKLGHVRHDGLLIRFVNIHIWGERRTDKGQSSPHNTQNCTEYSYYEQPDTSINKAFSMTSDLEKANHTSLFNSSYINNRLLRSAITDLCNQAEESLYL
jgi:hypothetical protein